MLTWDMTMDCGLGFVIAMLLTADCPMPTSPKSTVPGVTWTKPCEVEMETEVPHPEVDSVKQQATAKTRTVQRPLNERYPLASGTKNLSDPGEVRGATGMSEQHLSIPWTKGQDVQSPGILEIGRVNTLRVKICSCFPSQDARYANHNGQYGRNCAPLSRQGTASRSLLQRAEVKMV